MSDFRGKIVLDDVTFKLGIRKVTGVIHAEQGIVAFYVPNENIISRIPFPVTADMYETEVDAYVRLHTNELVLKPTKDDCTQEVLDRHDDFLDVSVDKEIMMSLFEEQKLKKIPQVAGFSIATFLGLIAAVVLAVLTFGFKMHLLIPFVVAVVIWAIGSVGSTYWKNTLNSMIAYDVNGKWVNMETGETNLSHNYAIPGY